MGGRVAIEVGLERARPRRRARAAVPGGRVRAPRLAPARARAAPRVRPAAPLARPRAGRAPVLVAVRRPRPRRPERRRHRRRRVPAHLPLAPARASRSSPRARNIYLDKPFGRSGFYPRLADAAAAGAVRLGLARPADPGRLQAPRRALAARAPSRSCSTAAATCRRSSARAHQRAARALPRPRRRARRGARGCAGGVTPGDSPTGTARAETAPRSGARRRPSRRAPGRRSSGEARLGCSAPSRASWRAGSRPPTSTSATPTTSARPCRACGCCRSLYFRGEVRGLGNIPEEGPVLLVGNHSGGNLTPDTIVFTLAFCAYFGVERAFHQLAHNLVLSMPGPGASCASSGRSPPRTRTPRKALELRRRAARLPRRRLRGPPADLGAPPGRLRRPQGLHPPRARAGRPDRPRRRDRRPGDRAVPLARRDAGPAAGLDRLFRLKVLPISLALPWGLNVGDLLGHLPLPAKITVEALPPIHLREEFGPSPTSTRSTTTSCG